MDHTSPSLELLWLRQIVTAGTTPQKGFLLNHRYNLIHPKSLLGYHVLEENAYLSVTYLCGSA